MKEKDAEIEALKKTTPSDSVSPATPDSADASSEVVEKLQSDITFLRHLVLPPLEFHSMRQERPSGV